MSKKFYTELEKRKCTNNYQLCQQFRSIKVKKRETCLLCTTFKFMRKGTQKGAFCVSKSFKPTGIFSFMYKIAWTITLKWFWNCVFFPILFSLFRHFYFTEQCKQIKSFFLSFYLLCFFYSFQHCWLWAKFISFVFVYIMVVRQSMNFYVNFKYFFWFCSNASD